MAEKDGAPSLGGRPIHRIALGCLPMSAPGRPAEERSVRTIHAALDAGVTLLDTADSYCLDDTETGHNERLIARALAGRREPVVVATKGGHIRPAGRWEVDGSPAHLRAACESSLRALGTEAIDLYQLHRPDPRVPFTESVGALRDLRDEGKVRLVGLSNVTAAQLAEAEAIVEIASVQNELSLDYAAPLANGEVAACERRGMPFLAWAPLGGMAAAAHAAPGAGPVRAAAEAHGVSAQRAVLAWLLACSPAIVPIVGASRPETIGDSLGAVELRLTDAELRKIAEAAHRSPQDR